MFKYPSTPQYRDFVKDTKDKVHPLDLIGTIKLHGTNASVQLPECLPFSRNNGLNIENDNFGFAKFVHENKEEFDKIYQQIASQIILVSTDTLVIYGEWAGKGIQQKVAISELPRTFYVFNIKVITKYDDHYWLKDFKIHSQIIKSIRDYPTFYLKYNPNAPEDLLEVLEALTLSVEEECPVSKAHGIEGIGEGIVWSTYFKNGDMLNFKVKGSKHSKDLKTRRLMTTPESVEGLEALVELILTTERLDKIFSEGKYTRAETGTFIKDVISDVFKEESDVVEKSGIAGKSLSNALIYKTKNYLHNKV